MKNFITILLVLSSPTLVAPTLYEQPKTIEISKPVKTVIVKDMDLFLHDLGHRESGNRYNIVNKF